MRYGLVVLLLAATAGGLAVAQERLGDPASPGSGGVESAFGRVCSASEAGA